MMLRFGLCALLSAGLLFGCGKDNSGGFGQAGNPGASEGQPTSLNQAPCLPGFDISDVPGQEMTLNQLRSMVGNFELEETLEYFDTQLQEGIRSGSNRRLLKAVLVADPALPSKRVELSKICSEVRGDNISESLRFREIGLLSLRGGQATVLRAVTGFALGRDDGDLGMGGDLVELPLGVGSRIEDYMGAEVRRPGEQQQEQEQVKVFLRADGKLEIRGAFSRSTVGMTSAGQRRTVLRPLANLPQPPTFGREPLFLGARGAVSSVCSIRGYDLFLGGVSAARLEDYLDIARVYREFASENFCTMPTGGCSLRGREIYLNDTKLREYSTYQDAIAVFRWLVTRSVCTDSLGTCTLQGTSIYNRGVRTYTSDDLRSTVETLEVLYAVGVCQPRQGI